MQEVIVITDKEKNENTNETKPSHEQDLDDYIFKDEPVKLHSER